MSDEDLDQMLGRLIRERAEHKRKLAGLNVELRRVGEHISSVGRAISQRCEAAEKGSYPAKLSPLAISMDAERYVDMDTLKRLLAEQEETYDAYSSADAGVSKLNP